jgi:hypothetical protein
MRLLVPANAADRPADVDTTFGDEAPTSHLL